MLKIEPKNIIVRFPNWIGDLVMATPILKDLRSKYPQARITVMVKKPLCEIIRKDENIDEIFCFEKPQCGFCRRGEKRNIYARLRAGKYDLGLLLTNSFSSAWWFFQGKVKNIIGFDHNFRSVFIKHRVKLTKDTIHQVEKYKKLLKPLQISISDTKPKLYITDEEKETAKELLYQRGYKQGSTLIGINAFAKYGSAKCWPIDRFKEVAKKLLVDKKNFVVFIGDNTSSESIKEVCKELPNRAINLAAATDLRELMSIISLCDIFLTNDSGPMHIASALNVPLISLFGSTSDILTGPYNGGVVINKQVKCSPCFKRICPIDFNCMTKITVSEVLDKIYELLDAKKTS